MSTIESTVVKTLNQQIETTRKNAAESIAVSLLFVLLIFVYSMANWHTLTAIHKDWDTLFTGLLVIAQVCYAAYRLYHAMSNLLRWRELLTEKYATK